jgi:hypothetical protein
VSYSLDELERDQEKLYELLDNLGSDFGSDDDDEVGNPPEETPPADDEEDASVTSDSEDEVPLSTFRKLHWKHGSFHSKDQPSKENITPSDVKTTNEYFEKYLDDDFFQLAATHTSQYFLQSNGKVNNVTSEEIKKMFGLHAIMGCIHFPRIHMYFNEKFKFPLIDGVMSRDRFYMLRTNLHVVDNLGVTEETKKSNRLWKIQPVIDCVRNRCRALERKEKCAFSIDEQMIPFLGRCPVRQFVKNKPRPVGLKNFVVTTSDGLVLDFEIYQGTTTRLTNRELGLGPSVVLRLVETLPENSYLYFDRYFTTVNLMDKLISLKLEATATIMTNRVKGFIFKKDNAMNREESEEVVRSDGKLCITKWKDNKSVMMLSTAFGKQPVSNVLRWNKLEKARVDISCPNVVKSYNEHMGGVDVCDQMMEYYRSFFRTRK